MDARSLWLSIPLLAILRPASGAPDEIPEIGTSTSPNLTLPRFVQSYFDEANSLRMARLSVDVKKTELLRLRDRQSIEIGATPRLGGRGYHYTSGAAFEGVGELGGALSFTHRDSEGRSLVVEGDTIFYTAEGRIGRNIRYGLNAEYLFPLLRNFDGREYRLEAAVVEAEKEQAEAGFAREQLLICADAIDRYVRRYVAQEKLRDYLELLKEKRRVWWQTSADYRRKLITRLDLLAAKSDWIFAKGQVPELLAELGRADAAVKAYYPTKEVLTLAVPAAVADPERSPRLLEEIIWEAHPELRALRAIRRALAQKMALVREQNRTELELSFAAGIDRFHGLFDPAANPADVTDLHGLVGLRYLLPLERPEVAYELRLLELSTQQLEEQEAEIKRRIVSEIERSVVTWEQDRAALKLIEEQTKVATSQIRAAYREFRAGKLEFQAYLDHWERYQTARLRTWDRRLSKWVSELSLILPLNFMPEMCRAQAD